MLKRSTKTETIHCEMKAVNIYDELNTVFTLFLFLCADSKTKTEWVLLFRGADSDLVISFGCQGQMADGRVCV